MLTNQGTAFPVLAELVADLYLPEDARAKVLPARRGFGIALMKEVGPLTGFRPIGRRTVDGGTEYSYRALFGRHPMKWRFVLDEKGRITDPEPSSGD